MYKKASRRTGGSDTSGWDAKKMRFGGGPVIQKIGTPPFPMPKPDSTDPPPTEKQLRFAYVISVKLRVAIPESCVQHRRCMKAFLDYFAPLLGAEGSKK